MMNPTTGQAAVQLRTTIAEPKFYELIKKLTNFKILLKTRILIMNAIVRSRLTYSCQTWNLTQKQMGKINSSYVGMLRKMIKGGYKTGENHHFILSNAEVLNICKTVDIATFVGDQQSRYLGHLARQSNTCQTKRLLFNTNKRTKPGRPYALLEDKVLLFENLTKDQFYKKALLRKDRHDHPSGTDRQLSSRR